MSYEDFLAGGDDAGERLGLFSVTLSRGEFDVLVFAGDGVLGGETLSRMYVDFKALPLPEELRVVRVVDPKGRGEN